jgi:hypothetical protein
MRWWSGSPASRCISGARSTTKASSSTHCCSVGETGGRPSNSCTRCCANKASWRTGDPRTRTERLLGDGRRRQAPHHAVLAIARSGCETRYRSPQNLEQDHAVRSVASRGPPSARSLLMPFQFSLKARSRLLRGNQGENAYCLTGECYPRSGCCLIEMLPLPHACGTEVPTACF